MLTDYCRFCSWSSVDSADAQRFLSKGFRSPASRQFDNERRAIRILGPVR